MSMLVLGPSVAPSRALAQENEPSAMPQATSETGTKPSAPAPGVDAPDDAAGFGGPAKDNHHLQTGFSIAPGAGYRLIVPYKENQACGDRSGQPEKRVCSNYVPFYTEFQLSFGVTSRLDVVMDLRFGIQTDPTQAGRRQFMFAPGLRFWLDQEVATKFYSTLQFAYDYMNFVDPRYANSDYGVRNVNGFMFDPIRNVGFFIQVGETIGLARWFRIDIDLGMGIQVRFP
jgi:hypothetical protein